MSTSGRAGLFTMDDGRFFGDLRGSPYTASKRQKSGALRLEFGTYTFGAALNTNASATITTTVNTGICAVATPASVPTPLVTEASGTFLVATPGAYGSAKLQLNVLSTGQYSGWNSGMTVNYMVIGY